MRWLKQLFTRDRRYGDLALSIEEHLEEKIEELMEDGMSRGDAERTARREFGNVTLIQERSREVWQWPTLESIWADMKFALRQLTKAPGFTATAVLTLSLGIAANATIFSLVSAFLFPHLPGHNPQNVVVISSVNPNQNFLPDTNAVSAPNYIAWRADTRVFAQMAAADEYRTAALTGQGEPESVNCAAVSPNYFNVFGVSPQLGRSFLAFIFEVKRIRRNKPTKLDRPFPVSPPGKAGAGGFPPRRSIMLPGKTYWYSLMLRLPPQEGLAPLCIP